MRARHLAAGQALGGAVHEEHQDIEGFIYASRLTGDDCIAVFGREVGKLRVVDAGASVNFPFIKLSGPTTTAVIHGTRALRKHSKNGNPSWAIPLRFTTKRNLDFDPLPG